jgi:hypothetical protein
MENYLWTKHSEYKLQQYALSQQRVRRVIRHPDRTEKSIVPGMVACMQIAGTSKNRQEIWVMYEVKKVTSDKQQVTGGNQEKAFGDSISKFKLPNSKFQAMSPAQKFRLERQQAFAMRAGAVGEMGKILRIISVWRYPGTSPERDPIPSEILEELRDMVR